MVTASDFRRLALGFDGAEERAHFDRAAFRVRRTFATLAADGLSANLKFTPDEQALKCAVMPQAFVRVPNAWGEQGWTTVVLAKISEAELTAALEIARRHAIAPPRKRLRR